MLTTFSTIGERNVRRILWLLALSAAIAASLTLLFPEILHDPAVTVGNARGTALIVLALAIPLLWLSLHWIKHGSMSAWLVCYGAVGYLWYNSVIFAFALDFNSFFLAYAAMFGLATWSIALMLVHSGVDRIHAALPTNIPRKVIAFYLFTSAVLFYLLWLADIVPGVVSNSAPSSLRDLHMITNPIQVMDIGLTLPLSIVGAIWLWNGRAKGSVLAGSMLVMLTIEVISVVADQTFGHLSDRAQSLAAVPMMAVFAVIGSCLTWLLFRGTTGRTRHRVHLTH